MVRPYLAYNCRDQELASTHIGFGVMLNCHKYVANSSSEDFTISGLLRYQPPSHSKDIVKDDEDEMHKDLGYGYESIYNVSAALAFQSPFSLVIIKLKQGHQVT